MKEQNEMLIVRRILKSASIGYEIRLHFLTSNYLSLHYIAADGSSAANKAPFWGCADEPAAAA